MHMKNWSTDIKRLKKDDKSYAIWKLNQLINFGSDKEKLSEKELKQYWQELSIDQFKRAFLNLLIWQK